MLVPGTYVAERDEPWLIVDDDYDEHLRLKEELLNSSEHRCNVLCRDEEDATLVDAERCTLELVVRELESRGVIRVITHSEGARGDGEVRIVERRDGRQFSVDEFTSMGRALELCALLAQEDWVLMKRRRPHDEHLVCSACVCFSFARVPSRIGKALVAVHAAVDGYATDLGNPMDKLISSLRPGRRMCRSNWDVKFSSSIINSDHREDEAGADDENFERLHIKVEYQTLLRLDIGDEQYTLFSIRSFVEPLTSIATCRGAAAGLAANLRAIESLPAFVAYKGIGDVGLRSMMLDYLDEVARKEDEEAV